MVSRCSHRKDIPFGVFALFYFLLQNGVISFPGTIEYGDFTTDFKKVLFALQMVLLMLGIGIKGEQER